LKNEVKEDNDLTKLALRAVYFPFVILWVIYAWIADLFLTRRWLEKGFKYVWVNEDGTAREVNSEERQSLMAKYQFGDGDRPYVKSDYDYKTPDGKMKGFLKRRHLPKNIIIDPAEKVDHKGLKP